MKPKKLKIPNLNEITKPIWLHEAGYGFSGKEGGWYKQEILEQATTPLDSKILKVLGIKKGEKVLAIAAYYASWASKLAKVGAEVDYSDISKTIIKYAKKEYGHLFKKYILSDFVFIPKKAKEYDWTFTFESCGGGQGLPLAYLRSLLNKKGGILVFYWGGRAHTGGKHKRYPRIVKNLSKIYSCNYKIKEVKLWSRRKGRAEDYYPHKIFSVLTNDSAREKAERDLNVLNYLQGKKKVCPDAKMLQSIKRLNKFSCVFDDKFVREVEVK